MKSKKPDSPYYRHGALYSKGYALTYDALTSLTGYARVPKVLAAEFAKVAENGASVLDFGCGTGRLSVALKKHNASLRITGMDPSPEMIKRYSEKFPHAAVIEAGYDNGLPLHDSQFDAVAATGVFDHFLIDAKLMKEFMRVVKPGGLVGFTYGRHDGAEPHKVAHGIGRDFNSYPDSYVKQAIEDAGAEVAHQSSDPKGFLVHFKGVRMKRIDFGMMIARRL
jgi:ubiquinone/menaquinone biosynthesis C-methylase UbiE